MSGAQYTLKNAPWSLQQQKLCRRIVEPTSFTCRLTCRIYSGWIEVYDESRTPSSITESRKAAKRAKSSPSLRKKPGERDESARQVIRDVIHVIAVESRHSSDSMWDVRPLRRRNSEKKERNANRFAQRLEMKFNRLGTVMLQYSDIKVQMRVSSRKRENDFPKVSRFLKPERRFINGNRRWRIQLLFKFGLQTLRHTLLGNSIEPSKTDSTTLGLNS